MKQNDNLIIGNGQNGSWALKITPQGDLIVNNFQDNEWCYKKSLAQCSTNYDTIVTSGPILDFPINFIYSNWFNSIQYLSPKSKLVSITINYIESTKEITSVRQVINLGNPCDQNDDSIIDIPSESVFLQDLQNSNRCQYTSNFPYYEFLNNIVVGKTNDQQLSLLYFQQTHGQESVIISDDILQKYMLPVSSEREIIGFNFLMNSSSVISNIDVILKTTQQSLGSICMSDDTVSILTNNISQRIGWITSDQISQSYFFQQIPQPEILPVPIPIAQLPKPTSLINEFHPIEKIITSVKLIKQGCNKLFIQFGYNDCTYYPQIPYCEKQSMEWLCLTETEITEITIVTQTQNRYVIKSCDSCELLLDDSVKNIATSLQQNIIVFLSIMTDDQQRISMASDEIDINLLNKQYIIYNPLDSIEFLQFDHVFSSYKGKHYLEKLNIISRDISRPLSVITRDLSISNQNIPIDILQGFLECLGQEINSVVELIINYNDREIISIENILGDPICIDTNTMFDTSQINSIRFNISGNITSVTLYKSNTINGQQSLTGISIKTDDSDIPLEKILDPLDNKQIINILPNQIPQLITKYGVIVNQNGNIQNIDYNNSNYKLGIIEPIDYTNFYSLIDSNYSTVYNNIKNISYDNSNAQISLYYANYQQPQQYLIGITNSYGAPLNTQFSLGNISRDQSAQQVLQFPIGMDYYIGLQTTTINGQQAINNIQIILQSDLESQASNFQYVTKISKQTFIKGIVAIYDQTMTNAIIIKDIIIVLSINDTTHDPDFSRNYYQTNWRKMTQQLYSYDIENESLSNDNNLSTEKLFTTLQSVQYGFTSNQQQIIIKQLILFDGTMPKILLHGQSLSNNLLNNTVVRNHCKCNHTNIQRTCGINMNMASVSQSVLPAILPATIITMNLQQAQSLMFVKTNELGYPLYYLDPSDLSQQLIQQSNKQEFAYSFIQLSTLSTIVQMITPNTIEFVSNITDNITDDITDDVLEKQLEVIHMEYGRHAFIYDALKMTLGSNSSVPFIPLSANLIKILINYDSVKINSLQFVYNTSPDSLQGQSCLTTILDFSLQQNPIINNLQHLNQIQGAIVLQPGEIITAITVGTTNLNQYVYSIEFIIRGLNQSESRSIPIIASMQQDMIYYLQAIGPNSYGINFLGKIPISSGSQILQSSSSQQNLQQDIARILTASQQPISISNNIQGFSINIIQTPLNKYLIYYDQNSPEFLNGFDTIYRTIQSVNIFALLQNLPVIQQSTLLDFLTSKQQNLILQRIDQNTVKIGSTIITGSNLSVDILPLPLSMVQQEQFQFSFANNVINQSVELYITENIGGIISTIKLSFQGTVSSNLPVASVTNIKLFDIKIDKNTNGVITNVTVDLYKLN